MGFTENQKEVINYGKGSLLVEAGPGSGKTTVLVERIIHLIDKGVDPETFLVITFTNKAADNLKFKLRKELSKREELLDRRNLKPNDVVLKMQISTIHSFCFNYLKNLKIGSEKKYETLTLIDDDASERKTLFIKKNKRRLGFKGYSTIFDNHIPDIIKKFDEYTSFNVDRDRLAKAISISRPVSQDYKDFIASMDYFVKKPLDDYDKPIKSERDKRKRRMKKVIEELNELEEEYPSGEKEDEAIELKERIESLKQEIKEWDDKRFNKVWYNARFLQIIESYPEYLDLLDEYNYVDYNTLQLKTLQELENDPNPPYKTVFVDEFQDTDPLQFRIFQELRKHCDYFTAVGDVDQHIYAFRSSFNDFFDELKKLDSLEPLPLDVNFRSTENIVGLTEEFIRPQRESKEREMHMKSDGKRCNNFNFLIDNRNEEEEALNIYRIIKTLIDKGIKESDIAILYRKHSSTTLANIVEIFKNMGINFSIKGQKNLKEQDEVRSIITLLWYVTRDTRVGRIPSDDELKELNLKALCGEYFETSFFSLDDSTKEYLCGLQDSYYKDVIKNENRIYHENQQDKIRGLKEELNAATTKTAIRKIQDKIERLERDKYSVDDISGVKGTRENYDSIRDIFKDLQLPIIDIEKITDSTDKEFFMHLGKIREEIEQKDSQTTQENESEEEEKEPLTILKVFYRLIALSNLYEYELSYNEIANLAILTQTISNYETFIYDTDFRGALYFLKKVIENYDSYQKEGEGVQLMTVHSAKGLEFPVTIIPSLEKDNFPQAVEDPNRENDYRYGSANYYTPNECLKYKTILKENENGKWVPKPISIEEENKLEEEEEDRVLYVGMTRAKYLLILSTLKGGPCQIDRIRSLDDTINCKAEELNEEKIIELLNQVEFECEEQNEEESTPEDELESLEEPVVLNYSKYTQYISCPFKFDLSYNLGFRRLGGKAANRGSVFHNIMENLNRKLKDGKVVSNEELEKIIYDNYNSMFDIERICSIPKEDLSKENLQKINDYEEFKANVEEYYDKYSVNREVLDAELDFELFRDDHILNGSIDLIYRESNGEVVSLDYKYAEYDEDHIDAYEKQAYIYASALREIPEYKDYDIKKAYIHFVLGDRKDNPYVVEIDENKMKEELNYISVVAREINNASDGFEKEPEKEGECVKCSYRYFCKPEDFAHELYDN